MDSFLHTYPSPHSPPHTSQASPKCQPTLSSVRLCHDSNCTFCSRLPTPRHQRVDGAAAQPRPEEETTPRSEDGGRGLDQETNRWGPQVMPWRLPSSKSNVRVTWWTKKCSPFLFHTAHWVVEVVCVCVCVFCLIGTKHMDLSKNWSKLKSYYK